MPENVIAGNGSDEIILLLMLTLLDKNDQVAVAAPDFSMYGFYADMVGAEVNTFIKKDKFSLKDFGKFVEKTNSKLCIFSNPCNPTGEGIEREDVLEFVKNCSAICVVDEAYMDFWDQSVLSDIDDYDNLIVLKTLSKAFGAAGIRLGFAAANQEFIRVLNVNRSPYNINTLSQLIGQMVLEKGVDNGAYLGKCAQALLPKMRKIMPYAKIHDTCANLLYIETEKAGEIYEYLKEKRISVKKSKKDALRITVTHDEEMIKVVEAIEEWNKEMRDERVKMQSQDQ